ncbi:hypothetical protein GCM10010082_11100 [Kushneria pakistanensis]|uniref:Minor curlin subunit n=1 Tax=Kushneria pakistanensis TaxID=1508770 RepID=A0ABQ3FEK2_9GAMM|nr:hypothetical protein [Kushneria pakistanensis]GHC21226.1 hypothetical protein GCM10010082_11100 [Kushneria pakistanensis]
MSLHVSTSGPDIRHTGWLTSFLLMLLPFVMSPVLAENNVALSRIEQFSTANLPVGAAQKYSVIEQVGHHNQAWVTQSASARYQQSAGIYQNGSHHQALISQQNANALGVITQNGSQHVASIYQNGSGTNTRLDASIMQFGSQGRVEITQSSSDQGISVVQHAYSGSARPVIIETYR